MSTRAATDDVRPHLSGLRRPRLFLHFFDTHFLQEKGVARFPEYAYREARLATRLAVMLADEVIVPAASFIESDLCVRVFREFSPEVFGTQIALTGGGSNLDEFIEDKRLQYRPEQAQGQAYRAAEINAAFPWQQRGRSATADIVADWRSDLSSGATERLFRALHGHLPNDHERLWRLLPERLGPSAFIVDNVVPLLFGTEGEVPITVRNRLHGVVNRSYFGSYAKDIGAAVFRNMAWLESPGPVPSGDSAGDVDFRRLEQACRRERVLDALMRMPSHELLDLREDPRFTAAVVAAAAGRAAGLREQGRAVELLLGWRAHGERTAVDFAPRVLLVTALPREAAAVEATFDRPATIVGHPGDPLIYKKGSYILPDGVTERSVLLATLPAMGTDSAAAVGTHAMRSFPSVKHILMVGIAGGCPNPAKSDEHVRLGDVVVSDDKGIMDYGHVKMTPDGPEYRSHPQAPSAAMLNAFRALVAGELLGDRPWERHLTQALARENLSNQFARPAEDRDVLRATGGPADNVVPHPVDPDRRPGLPRVFGAGVGTADILLKDPAIRDKLRDKFGVRAIEMEGSGLQTAAWVSGNDVIVVRGICDYCDPYKNDDWQFYAALAAAAYARALVEILPDEWFR